MTLGDESFVEAHGSPHAFTAKFARWGRVPDMLWYLIPIAAFIGSAYFLTRVVKP